MELVRDLNNLPERLRGCALTIGNFDGVHQGHAEIVKRLRAKARELGGPAVVFTFDPHPAQLLRPDQAPAPLTWTGRKAELMERFGVDAVVVYPTDRDFLNLEARAFFDKIVRRRLDARAMVEGQNFFFGRGRQGDVDVLRKFCSESDMSLDVVEPLLIGGMVVSSSRIRRLIAEGDVGQAVRMLAAPYRIRGTVTRGAGRGAGLGFPTANLDGVDTLLPSEGIYAGRSEIDGRRLSAAISLGPNPTFDEGEQKVEIHLVDYEGSLYDRRIEVDFLARLRDIERFDSVGELIAQMDRDVASCRQIAEQYAEHHDA